jgi:ATP-binding cassette subfamily B protein
MKHIAPPEPSCSSPHPLPDNAALGDATFARTFQHLWPYIWPHDRADLRMRIFLAVVLLIAGKLVTIAIPYAFKWATDALTGEHAKDMALPALIAGPIALTLLYGALRIVMAFLTQLRDGLFAAVAMNAVRRLANDVFIHMHRLSLRFHLERKTGGLTRILERGRNAIETIVRLVMLTGVR